MALPGISFEIVRSAGPVLGIRTDRTALLMLAARGPVETPVLVHSYNEFVDVFGCQVDGMLGALAAKAYYQNGGQELVVARFVPDEAQRASAQAPVVGATTPGGNVQLIAADVGAFGNRIQVDSFLTVRKRCRAAATSATLLTFSGLTAAIFAPSDAGLPIRLQSAASDGWNRVASVGAFSAGTQTLVLQTALVGPLPTDLIAEVYERTFSLRIREPMRADVIVDELDLTNIAASNLLLENSVVRLLPPAAPGVELPAPNVVTTFSGGQEGLAPSGSVAGLQASFSRALAALEVSALPNIVAAPDLWSRVYKTKGIDRLAFTPAQAINLTVALLQSVTRTRDRIAIVDPPLGGADGLRPYGPSELLQWRSDLEATLAFGFVEARDFGVVYTPWPRIVAGPIYRGDATLLVPPSAFVAGQVARTARERGPWVATGNVALEGLVALDQSLSADDQEALQAVGINPLRIELPQGVTIQGVRALAWPDRKPWRFISTRALFNFLQRALTPIGLSYTFEPNSPATWIQLRRDIERLLRDLFAAGALAGNTPSDAFFVKVDDALNPEPNRDNGVLTALIGVAPALPLEFLVVRLELGRGITRVVEEPIAT